MKLDQGIKEPISSFPEGFIGRIYGGSRAPSRIGLGVPGLPGWNGESFNETGDFTDVGNIEEYAIPYVDYVDPNTGGNAPGYQGSVVSQGRGTNLKVAEGVGYEEIYVIPFTSSDTDLTGYQDPNTGGAAPGYQGDYVTGADDGSPNTTEGNEGKMALESYEIGSGWDGTQGGVIDANQDPNLSLIHI